MSAHSRTPEGVACAFEIDDRRSPLDNRSRRSCADALRSSAMALELSSGVLAAIQRSQAAHTRDLVETRRQLSEAYAALGKFGPE
jgi:hypothetical protein